MKYVLLVVYILGNGEYHGAHPMLRLYETKEDCENFLERYVDAWGGTLEYDKANNLKLEELESMPKYKIINICTPANLNAFSIPYSFN